MEARRLGARYAAMIIAAFDPLDPCHEEFRHFAGLFGVSGTPDRLERLPAHQDPELWIGWIRMEEEEG